MNKPSATPQNQPATRGNAPANMQGGNRGGANAAWDNQYWSLWVTNNGGGTFKDIWTASTFSTNGLYVNNTSTASRIYAMSLEHHVRNEARFKNVSNWKVYVFQTEEESVESTECQPIELENCKDMTFADVYMFRVIRINEPYHNSIRLWNCENINFINIHNYSQIKYTTDVPFYDVNKNIEVRPWELQKMVVTGKETRREPLTNTVGKLRNWLQALSSSKVSRATAKEIFIFRNNVSAEYISGQ